MRKIVEKYIEEQKLLQKDGLYIVALSGGADSVALLLVMNELGYHVEAAHCNFHLRGEESNEDERFVVALCEKKQIELHRIHFDTLAYAGLHKVSIEMAARELRYHYFEQLRNDIGAEAICVAHHRDDSVETVLINLIRGTGIHGLTGIRPKQGFVIRPLLCVCRQEIEQFLKERGQDYVTDSTNLVDDVVRNKIRLNILPLLRTINPSVDGAIAKTAEQLAEAERIYSDAISKVIGNGHQQHFLSIEDILAFSSPESLLFEWLQQYGFSPATIRQIAAQIKDAETGTMWSSATHRVIINRGRIEVAQKVGPMKEMRIPEVGCYNYDDTKKFRFTLCETIEVNRSLSHASLDAQKVLFPLTIRPVKEGDRFVPFGMSGSRLLSDYLTDLKVSRFERHRQLVVTDASGEIIWVVNRRPSQHFCITAATTALLDIHFLEQ